MSHAQPLRLLTLSRCRLPRTSLVSFVFARRLLVSLTLSNHRRRPMARFTQRSATTTATTPPLDSPTTTSPKITQIVDQIQSLTLLEASQLVESLKTRLNIADIVVPMSSSSSSQASSSTSSDSDSASEAEAAAAVPKEKTSFTIKLLKIDATQKAKVIKEVKTIMPNMNLVEAKKFVESLPKVLKENATKDEVEKLKKSLETVGASIEVE